MDILNLLIKDHRTVSELFKSIENTGEKAYKKRLNIFEKIYTELNLHAEVEETIFYPVIEKFKETKAITLESYEEHTLVKQLLTEIKGITPQEETWQAKLTVLKELVEHHVKEEEKDLFPKVKKVLPLEERKLMGEKMQNIKLANNEEPSSVVN